MAINIELETTGTPGPTLVLHLTITGRDLERLQGLGGRLGAEATVNKAIHDYLYPDQFCLRTCCQGA